VVVGARRDPPLVVEPQPQPVAPEDDRRVLERHRPRVRDDVVQQQGGLSSVHAERARLGGRDRVRLEGLAHAAHGQAVVVLEDHAQLLADHVVGVEPGCEPSGNVAPVQADGLALHGPDADDRVDLVALRQVELLADARRRRREVERDEAGRRLVAEGLELLAHPAVGR
jgi:hypothetical protein